MDGHGEYSPLERSRLLGSSLESSSGGNGGNSSAGSNGGHPPSVSELAARAATPTTLTSLAAQYHSRYGLPSHLAGSNYALMSSLLSGAHGSEARKALLPDIQHYWSAHADNFPRYLMTGGLYPPYPPLIPGAAESLSLLGAGVACVAGGAGTGAGPSQSQVAHYQRFLEMQKEAYIASMSAAAAANHHPALYGISTGALPPFLEQTPVSSHGATPLSLVKQEPKELSCTEKTAKQGERRSMGFKVDLDHNRTSKETSSATTSGGLPNTQLKEPKLSPSSSLGPPGKYDKKASTSSISQGSNGHQSGKRSSPHTAASSTPVPRHHQESIRYKCTSPSSKTRAPTPQTAAPASKSSSNNGATNNSSSKKNGSKSGGSASKHSKTGTMSTTGQHSLTGSNSSSSSPLSESPIVSVPTQAAAPIPLATVQHDGVVLSALASPSSAAASSASAKPATIKQQADKLNRSLTSSKDSADTDKPVPEASTSAHGASDRRVDTTLNCGGNKDSQTNSNNVSGNTDNTISDRNREGDGGATVNQSEDCKQISDDNSDIVVDSTENDDAPAVERSVTSTKSDHDRAIEETIERVASAADTDSETGLDNVSSQSSVKTSETAVTSLIVSVTRTETTCIVTSSGTSAGTRTVYAKTQPVPSVTVSGNIPVGIAVAQIRPHHIKQPRDSQASESHSRDIRHVYNSSTSTNTNTQTTSALAAPSTALPPNLLVTGRTVNPSSWPPQMPFTLHHPAINSSGATFDASPYPITPPSGFKFVQDSLTGQIFLVPSGGTGQAHFQSKLNLPTITINGPEDRDGRPPTESNSDNSKAQGNPTDKILSSSKILSKDRMGLIRDGGKHHAIANPVLGSSSLGSPQSSAALTSAAATILVNPVTSVPTLAGVKTEQPTFQSRGCSPIMFEDVSSSLSLLSTLSSLTSRKPTTCSVGVQTCESLMKTGRKRKPSPLKLSVNDQGVQTSSPDLTALNPLSVQCPDLDSVDPLTHSLEVKAAPERPSYNPFTDPQILQAADGLELLSTLAEKRPKCSSLDDPKRIFPSPSDSFKSDSASIVAMEDTLSPGDSELKSGQCTPRRDVRRDLSPKWTLPKKEPQTISTLGDFKTPPEIEIVDAIEVRVKLAEVQRQYKEKQKELAKLQSKKSEEGKPSKRGPGRPPKKKSLTKKSDDDSSSSSSKTKDNHQPQKKKRPAEELVDRVFRKLPPVIKPSKASRSIHYVKSKTGPFFKRKSASSSVKRNKDLFGCDESNWPSFSERKHQEKIKGGDSVSGKSKSRHRSNSSQSEDSKHSHDAGNIFSNLETYSGEYVERRGRPPKNRPRKDSKSSNSSTPSSITIKSEPSCSSSHQESGLGLLAKFALTTSATPAPSAGGSLSLASLTAPSLTSAISTPSYSHTTPASTTSTFSNTTFSTTSFSTTTFSTTTFSTSISSSSIYGSGFYNSSSIYNMSNAGGAGNAPNITFGSMSSLMSASNSSLMSFTNPSTSSPMVINNKDDNGNDPSKTSPVSVLTTSVTVLPTSMSSPASSSAASSTTTTTASDRSTSSSSPGLHQSTTEESSSGATCASDVSPAKRKHDDDSDTDTSDTSPNKKRKPGRPRKINPDISSGGTETIWAKKSSSKGLLQVSDSGVGHSKDGESKKLDPNAMKPLFLDEEWTRRRSERIFLSEPSPQPSPALSPSPRGEPVWKLSHFMPKSKKSLDVNKSVKPNEGEKDKEGRDSKDKPPTLSIASSPSKAFPFSSTPTLSSSSGVSVKKEDDPKPSTSVSSSSSSSSTMPNLWPAKAKTAEISTPKAEDAKKIIKAEDHPTSSTESASTSFSTESASSPAKFKKSSTESDSDKPKAKKNKKVKKDAKPSSPSSPLPPTLEKRGKRTDENSKMKLQKAKSLHDLSQKVKKKYSKANTKKQDDQPNKKSKRGRKKRKVSTDSSDNENQPLSSYRDGPPTPEPRSCKLQTTDLREGLKVLYLNDGLFYEGTVKALQPPDVYGVLTSGQRGTRPHILCQEEVLKDAVLDVRPGSIRYLPEGTRVCAFWSQQFSCLYPGTVAKASPTQQGQTSVSVDFDDGDSGRIPIDHIRLLPSDFPIVEYEPDPLENLPKRRRRTASDASDVRKPNKSAKREEDDDEEEENDDKSDDENSKDENSDDSESSSSSSGPLTWRWTGEGTRRPGLKGRARKIFYKSVARGKEEINVGDSAVFVSKERVDCPYIGRIESLWESWSGQMMVKVRWYYHPEETHVGKKLNNTKDALFESQHEDENDVQTISHKCEVLSAAAYKNRKEKKQGKKEDLFYVAGFYDPAARNITFHPGVS